MNNQYLATYLIDHLAGSVAALELLEGLKATYADTALTNFFTQLQTDIAADREELQSLMDRLQVVEPAAKGDRMAGREVYRIKASRGRQRMWAVTSP